LAKIRAIRGGIFSVRETLPKKLAGKLAVDLECAVAPLKRKSIIFGVILLTASSVHLISERKFAPPLSVTFRGYTNWPLPSADFEDPSEAFEIRAVFELSNNIRSSLQTDLNLSIYKEGADGKWSLERSFSNPAEMRGHSTRLITGITPGTTNGWRFFTCASAFTFEPKSAWRLYLRESLSSVGIHPGSLAPYRHYPNQLNKWDNGLIEKSP
jgi:hypothetical protein